jgi:beta-galactosidase/beta-glucuronidase
MLSQSKIKYVVCLILSAIIAVQASGEVQVLKSKVEFNQSWKFYKGDASGASGTSFNDASWASVNIPHSPTYDTPTPTGEAAYYIGTCWYRKSFALPANVQKVFVEFEGAMQVATVYLNGTQIGVHNNSGYTPFFFDISNQVVRGGNNVIAISLNNTRSADIPPGWANSGPDYYLFGGLNRSVWLHFKDSVYVPVYSQQVIPIPNSSATSAQLHVRTPVMNESKAAQDITVTFKLFDASNTMVASQTATQSVSASTLDTFDMTSTTFTCSPWTPQTPNMYTVRTVVAVSGTTVDSVVEPCGFRVISWSTTNGLSINGTRMQIHGMCLHQNIAWIESAIPDERYYYEVKVIKDMGANSIRCSHYPRAQAFYNACDKLGMLVYPEAPSWGWSLIPTALCMSRVDSCVREMVLSARNHPCIYAWGLYNEPNGASSPPDFTPYFTAANNIAHALDSTRLTAIAFNGTCSGAGIPDVIGLNYATSISGTDNGKNLAEKPWFGCEARNTSTFGTDNYRGSNIDLDTADDNAYSDNAYNEWLSFSFSTATSGHLAGGHFWEFKDHFSSWNPDAYEGVADNFDIPKTMYHYFAKKWAPSYIPDYARAGTPTKVDFQADTSSLPADSVNVFLLTAALRDENNHLISANCNVQFTLSDPTKGIIFGGNTVTVMGGIAAAFLRTSKSSGTFTVTATASCNSLSSKTVTLTTTAVPEEIYVTAQTGIGLRTQKIGTVKSQLTTKNTASGIIFLCPKSAGRLTIVDCGGRTIFSQETRGKQSLLIKRQSIGMGIFYGVWEDGKQHLVSSTFMLY